MCDSIIGITIKIGLIIKNECCHLQDVLGRYCDVIINIW